MFYNINLDVLKEIDKKIFRKDNQWRTLDGND